MLIPRSLLEGVEQAEVRKERGVIVVVPVTKSDAPKPDDPIFELGKHPVVVAEADVNAAATPETLRDFLSGYVGTVDGTSEALSEDCGRRFAEGMAQKQRRGRL